MARRTNQYFLFVFLFFMLGSTILGLLLINFLALPSDLANIILQFLVFIPMLVIYVKTEKVSVKECFSLRPLNWKNALLCLGIAYCALPFISMIVVLTSPLQPNLVEQAMGELNDSSLFSMLFVIAVQPAVFEELLFRGAALHGYRSLGAKKALLMSALDVCYAAHESPAGVIRLSAGCHLRVYGTAYRLHLCLYAAPFSHQRIKLCCCHRPDTPARCCGGTFFHPGIVEHRSAMFDLPAFPGTAHVSVPAAQPCTSACFTSRYRHTQRKDIHSFLLDHCGNLHFLWCSAKSLLELKKERML